MAIKAGQMTLWAALASGVGYLALTGLFYASSPTPDVDYSIQMNQKVAAIPEDERAWPVYREAWTKFKFSEGGGGSSFAEIFTKDDQGESTNELIRPRAKAGTRQLTN